MEKNKVLLVFCLIVALLSCKSSSEVKPEVGSPEKSINYNSQTVYDLVETYSAFFEKERLLRMQKSADFTPTGIYMKPGEKISVQFELLSGNPQKRPYLLIGNYSRNLWNDRPSSNIIMTDIDNEFTNTSQSDQHLYIRFSSDDPDAKGRLTINGGHKTPMFTLGETSNEAFREMLKTYTFSDAFIQSEKAFVLASKKTIERYINQDWTELMSTIDQVIDVEANIDGLDGSSPSHIPNRNKYFLTESKDENYWMAATDYRTFYNESKAIDFVIDLEKLQKDGWGPWHEIGHQNQIASLTWFATVEVTTNIYSLAVERNFGITSRMQRENRWEDVAAYLNSPLATRNYNDDEQLGAFTRLGLYQQLWLAYGDDFFINLHKKAREEAKDFYVIEDKMTYFMLKASEVSGHDLSDFFRAWGFQLSEANYQKVKDLSLPSPDINLLTLGLS